MHFFNASPTLIHEQVCSPAFLARPSEHVNKGYTLAYPSVFMQDKDGRHRTRRVIPRQAGTNLISPITLCSAWRPRVSNISGSGRQIKRLSAQARVFNCFCRLVLSSSRSGNLVFGPTLLHEVLSGHRSSQRIGKDWQKRRQHRGRKYPQYPLSS